ncbi:MAG: IS982 family transposase [Alphaproteobacteria bacterium]|nr:IS982 family transposase [Alphaproteobacteria bacterium]
MDITRLFCLVDDFLKALEEERKKKQIEDGKKPRKPTRTPGLTESEVATIVLMFQESPCCNFKYFYKSYLQQYKPEFPKMPSCERFVALIPRILYFLTLLFRCTLRKKSKIAYINSTSLNVCHPKRIYRNRVFKGLAKRGKTTKGWFFGFKLHIIIDAKENLMNAKLTKGYVDDRSVVPQMTANRKDFCSRTKATSARICFFV